MILDNKNTNLKVHEWIAKYTKEGKFSLVTGYFTIGALAYLSAKINEKIEAFNFVLGDIVHTENVKVRTIDLLNDNITIEAALKLSSLANAVAHRDYSQYVRGSYIQIRMFADRLEVQSPGGLFGNVTVENLDEEHSTRNARLMRIMEDMQIVENRGSGIRAISQAMREANLEPPKFDDRRSSFKVTLRNLTLMSREAISWLNQFSHLPLNDRQRLSLVYLRHHNQIINNDYRRLNRVDTMIAGQELRALVQANLIEQKGASRWTYYTLKASLEIPEEKNSQTDEDKILAYVQKHGSINNTECRDLLVVDSNRASYLLKKMAKTGILKQEGTRRWTKYSCPKIY